MSANEFLSLIIASRLVDENRLGVVLEDLPKTATGEWDLHQLATFLVAKGVLTSWQCEKLLKGRWKGFLYKLVDRIGTTGMSVTYVAEDMITGGHITVTVGPYGTAHQET